MQNLTGWGICGSDYGTEIVKNAFLSEKDVLQSYCVP